MRNRAIITVREITCVSALTRTGGFLSTYTHTLQPYVGCRYRCPYCYVQALPVHRYHGGSWGSYVDVKTNAPEVLERELAGLKKRGQPVRVFLSSATDPYQGAEARYRITRGCLEKFAPYPPDLLVVQTRSPMARRDFDLLRSIETCVLSVTIETDDERARRAITPYTPGIRHRLETLEAAMSAGLTVQVAISPMLPNNPQRLAELLHDRCHRVVVDTFFDGDGAGGRRTEQLGIRDLYLRKGYASWYSRTAHHALFVALQDRLGPDRVTFSKEGFNSVEAMI